MERLLVRLTAPRLLRGGLCSGQCEGGLWGSRGQCEEGLWGSCGLLTGQVFCLFFCLTFPQPHPKKRRLEELV